MKVMEKDCNGCPRDIGCLGAGCPKGVKTTFYCDDCGGEIVGNVMEYRHHHYHAECVIYPLLRDGIIEEEKI